MGLEKLNRNITLIAGVCLLSFRHWIGGSVLLGLLVLAIWKDINQD
jgi:hypothetical protein